MIDTHAHLERLCDIDKGIDKIILAASDVTDSKNNLLLGEIYPDKLLVSVGIHPMESQDSPAKLEKIVEENYQKIGAIGECGLDFSGEFDKEKQIIVFKKQIELAQKYKLPLIIHARKAVDEVVEILKEYKDLSGVFHCYAGGNKRIKKILDLGFYFGIDGNLTYEAGLEEVVKNIPKDRLVLETDSPYLTPVPFRGEINSPKNVEYIYKKVAEIWDLSFEETEKIVDGNAKRLFGF
ncbi:MAG: TatD family hydrolase [Candidatus Shapirobacteria bacterium]|nr:TatD family hydrolase [Candidatus Shapirobacteria bacterium]MDD4410792.1 TatD family hydrolase [Candidatus Shapirobacteria bacterium]